MAWINEKETQEKIIPPLGAQTKQHKQLNQVTVRKYEQLSYFEQEEIIRWLKKKRSKHPHLNQNQAVRVKRAFSRPL